MHHTRLIHWSHGPGLGLLLGLTLAGCFLAGLGYAAAKPEALPTIGPAPEFTLTTQDGERLALTALRGKVVVLTFIYVSCMDTCPLLTSKMVSIQKALGADFASQVFFLSITVDPERDTPAVLQRYARALGVNFTGWAFLTGTAMEIRQVARQYGIYYKKTARGEVNHTFQTSLVDRHGSLRVHYLGVRFDPDELHRDLQGLLQEEAEP